MTVATVEAALARVIAREGGAPGGWARQIHRYLDLLLERNASVNLVSRKTADDALARHVLPSLAALRVVPPKREIRVLDVGSGGGFPGIPLRILRPAARVDLVEATGKKCDFLEECLTMLGLDGCEVHRCRIEAPTQRLRERAPFGVALARAVGAEDLLRRAVEPLVAPGGSLWVFSPPGEDTTITWEDADGSRLTGLRDLLR